MPHIFQVTTMTLDTLPQMLSEVLRISFTITHFTSSIIQSFISWFEWEKVAFNIDMRYFARKIMWDCQVQGICCQSVEISGLESTFLTLLAIHSFISKIF
jgi:hypothetical protein